MIVFSVTDFPGPDSSTMIILGLFTLIGTVTSAWFAMRASVHSKPVSNGFTKEVMEQFGYIRGTLDAHIKDSEDKHEELAAAAAAAQKAAEAAMTAASAAAEVTTHTAIQVEKIPQIRSAPDAA